MQNEHLSVPIRYELSEYDDRYTRIRIYVMHDKLNLNGSYFSMSTIENAKDSIKNIPILAFVKKNDGTNELDFGGHEMEMVITSEGEIETKYLGRPIGVIPESNNNYHYETFDDKSYVVVDGYIWNDYANEALEILNRDKEHSQSMEIAVDDATWDEQNNWYEITKYRYTGLCVLGTDVKPAMVNAKVRVLEQNEKQFSVKYYELVQQLCDMLNNNSVKEVDGMEDNLIDVPVEEVVNETFSENSTVINNINEEVVTEVQEVEVQEQVVEEQVNYEAQLQELKQELENKDNEIFNLNTALNNIKQEYDTLQTEVKELKEYKAKVEDEKTYAEKQQVFAKYSIGLTAEEMQPVMDKINTLSVTELKTELNDIFTTKTLSEISKKFNSDHKDIVMDMPKKDNPKSKYAVI